MYTKNLNSLLKNQNFHRSLSKTPFQSFSSSSKSKTLLTQHEINEINLLIPRLCLTDNIKTAIHLTLTALTTPLPPPPPTKSLSFSILVHSLTSQPDLTLPMSLLTQLKHTPQAHTSATPLCTSLVCSFLKRGRPKDALKVYSWMLRPDSPCGGLGNMRCLLREARVKEARDLDAALRVLGSGGDESLKKKVLDLLDQIIASWNE